MTKLFQGKNGGAPFPRTESEWVEKRMSQGHPFEDAQAFAQRKVTEDVFGHDYQVDAKGAPIERGKGSALQPTAQHHEALQIAEEAKARRAMTMGWHPGLASAFDPRAQAIIDDLMAKVERLSRKATPRRKPRAAARKAAQAAAGAEA